MVQWIGASDGSWSGPIALPGGLNLPASFPCAIGLSDGSMHVFAIGAGGLFHGGPLVRWSGDGNNWNAPVIDPSWNLPADGNGLAVTSWGASRLDVFGITPGGIIHQGADDAGQLVNANEPPLPGSGGQLFTSVPAAVSWPGRLDVFAVHSSGVPWHWTWQGVWSGPFALDANLPVRGPTGFAAVPREPGRIDLIAIATDGTLRYWPIGNSNASQVLPGTGNVPGGWNLPGGIPAAVAVADHVEVFAIGPGDLLRGGSLLRWRRDDAVWSGPVWIDGNLAAGGIGVAASGGRIDAFGFHSGIGGDNSLQHWPAAAGANNEQWANWAGNRALLPAAHCHPTTVEDLVAIVKEAERNGRHVRAVGSSWSFSDVAMTPDYLVETNQLNKVLSYVVGANPSALNDFDWGSGRTSTLNLIHVEAGIKLADLMTILDARGLAPKTMGGSDGQTLAGVISTSVHGCDFDKGPVPDMVRAIHLVGPGGIQHWIEPGRVRNISGAAITDPTRLQQILGLDWANIHYDDQWFNAALVSVGSMGVIYSVILDVDAQYDLVETRASQTWDVLRPKLVNNDPFNDPNTGVQIAIDPGTNTCYLFTRRRDTASQAITDNSILTLGLGMFCHTGALEQIVAVVDITVIAPIIAALRALFPPINLLPPGAEFLPAVFIPALKACGPGGVGKFLGMLLNSRADLTAQVVTALHNFIIKDGTSRGFAHTLMAPPSPVTDCLARGLSLEIAFDAGQFHDGDWVSNGSYLGFVDDALALLKQAREKDQLVLGGWFSLRFVGGSRAYLSPQRFDRTCMIEFTGLNSLDSTAELLRRLEALGKSHGGIQHWGQFYDLNAADVFGAYEHLDTWRQIRRLLTSGGALQTFDNDFAVRCGLAGIGAAGSVIGIGMDNSLYTRATLNSSWVHVPNSGDVLAVAQMNNGTLLAIGMDNSLYTRATLNSTWIHVSNSGDVLGVTQLNDGTILGIGMDHSLYMRATLNSSWVHVPNSGDVLGLSQMSDGTILGIGMDHSLYMRATLNSSWVHVPDSGDVLALTRMIDGTILAIGMDRQLYTRATLNSTWVQIPNSGAVLGITIR